MSTWPAFHAARLLLHQRFLDTWVVGPRNAQNLEITQFLFVRLSRLMRLVFIHLVADVVEILVMLRVELLEKLQNLLLVLVSRRVLLDWHTNSHPFAESALDGTRAPSTPVGKTAGPVHLMKRRESTHG